MPKFLYETLYDAVENCDLEATDAALAAGANTSWIHPLRVRAALHTAVRNNAIEIVSSLLNADADVRQPDGMGNTALHIAAANGFADIVALLLTKSDSIVDATNILGDTPLHVAAEKGEEAIAIHLLDAGANVNCRNAHHRTPLHTAAIDGPAEVIDVLLAETHVECDPTDKFNLTPLFYAALYGRTEVVCKLADAGADINFETNIGVTPLIAAIDRHRDTARAMLQRPAINVNAFPKDGHTALYHAVHYSAPDLVTQLLEAGADIHYMQADSMSTVLHLAVDDGRVSMVQLLLRSGVHPDCPDHMLDRPLHALYKAPYATKHYPLPSLFTKCGVAIITALLEHGADVNAINVDGETALDCVTYQEGHDSSIVPLLASGAKFC